SMATGGAKTVAGAYIERFFAVTLKAIERLAKAHLRSVPGVAAPRLVEFSSGHGDALWLLSGERLVPRWRLAVLCEHRKEPRAGGLEVRAKVHMLETGHPEVEIARIAVAQQHRNHFPRPVRDGPVHLVPDPVGLRCLLRHHDKEPLATV